jgi:hypothetical protein
MGRVVVSNIVVGEGKLFIGPDQSTVDTDVTSVGDNSQYNVGSTQDGVAISWEPDMVDIEVDQLGDAARVIQSKQKVMLKTTLAEAHLKNLADAWGYATGVTSTQPGLVTGYTVPNGTTTVQSTGTFNIGIHSVYPTEKYVRIEGNAPGSSATSTVYRTYKNRRCIQFSSSEHALNRTDNVKFPIEFRVLPDSTQTGKEYGTIVDASSAPYSPYL